MVNSREMLRSVLSFAPGAKPPRWEGEFYEGLAEVWQAQGAPADFEPERFFQLDRHETLLHPMRRDRKVKRVVDTEENLEFFREHFALEKAAQFPEDLERQLDDWAARDFAVAAGSWCEGFLQVAGISDWASFYRVMDALFEVPELLDAALERYGAYLEATLERLLPRLTPDYAVCYEAIASNHAPVISPAMYARFAGPAQRRLCECLERRGVRHRFVWSSGAVRPLIPVWLENGINGLILTQTRDAGISYRELRREFGAELRLIGGVDWQVLLEGPAAIDAYLDREVRPLLEQGGYVPHLDDRVRPSIPFAAYRHYRRQLDALIDSL